METGSLFLSFSFFFSLLFQDSSLLADVCQPCSEHSHTHHLSLLPVDIVAFSCLFSFLSIKSAEVLLCDCACVCVCVSLHGSSPSPLIPRFILTLKILFQRVTLVFLFFLHHVRLPITLVLSYNIATHRVSAQAFNPACFSLSPPIFQMVCSTGLCHSE